MAKEPQVLIRLLLEEVLLQARATLTGRPFNKAVPLTQLLLAEDEEDQELGADIVLHLLEVTVLHPLGVMEITSILQMTVKKLFNNKGFRDTTIVENGSSLGKERPPTSELGVLRAQRKVLLIL